MAQAWFYVWLVTVSYAWGSGEIGWPLALPLIVVPGHVARIPAWDRANHPDCEWGTVSSVNEHTVFVKFDTQVSKFGWDGTTSQGCNRNSLLNATGD